MDTIIALAMGEASRGKESMVFDWVKAAQLIKEAGAITASAGLRGDWEFTGGDILRDGKPLPREETYVYLASTWAVPELMLGEGEAVVECFKMKSEVPNWDASTYWPEEAVAVLTA